MLNATRIFFGLVSACAAFSVNAETRGEFLRTADCATAFLKVAMIFQAKRSIGETVDGKEIGLQQIDFWEQRSRRLLDFLFNDSVFSDESEAIVSREMDSWLLVQQQNRSLSRQSALESTAITTALDCNDEFASKGWFQ